MNMNLLPEPFERFVFQPLSFRQVLGYFRGQKADEFLVKAEEIFSRWLLDFHHKSLLFYQYQYTRHEDVVYTAFRKRYRIAEGDSPGDYGVSEEWSEWRERYGLDEHEEEYREMVRSITESENTRAQQGKRNINESMVILDKELNLEKIEGLQQELNTCWFDSTIGNPDEKVQELRELSYERYLFTSHWKKVRAAMLLINRASCQAEECYASGDSWYGGNWETDLHVHHLDYTNKGNERFADLALLCSKHHEAWHTNMKNYGEPKIKIVKF